MRKQFIPGIYNYCDRWCERCLMTSYCRNYEGLSKLSPEQLDINNKAYWDHIASNMQDAITLLHKAAKERGFDLSTPLSQEEETQYLENEKQIRKGVTEHELTLLCKKYEDLTIPFCNESGHFVDKTRELVNDLHLGLHTEEDVVYTVRDIGDCFEIIQWYVYFIDAKLQRALRGILDENKFEGEDEIQNDSNGSAKIAMIAIERSIAAFAKLFSLLPKDEDVILQALSTLQQLEKKSKKHFPNAMAFTRPGFDE